MLVLLIIHIFAATLLLNLPTISTRFLLKVVIYAIYGQSSIHEQGSSGVVLNSEVANGWTTTLTCIPCRESLYVLT